jgi:hypothetical protein
MENLNFYEILGVPFDSGFDEIRATFRRLVFKYHPDRNSEENALERFESILEAYRTLSDSELRRVYDAKILSNARETIYLKRHLDSQSQDFKNAYDKLAKEFNESYAVDFEREYLVIFEGEQRRKKFIASILVLIFILLFYFISLPKTSSINPEQTISSSGLSTSGMPEVGAIGSQSPGLDQRIVVVGSGSSGGQVLRGQSVGVGSQGSQGVAGERGLQGVQGIPGLPGAPGIPGVAGANGAPGAQGVAGPAGPPGVAGVAGAQGPAGPSGPSGPSGATGATGATGAAGTSSTSVILRPNIGSLAGSIYPCTYDPVSNDTTTINVSITPTFNTTAGEYTVGGVVLSNIPAACAGNSIAIDIQLTSTSNASAVYSQSSGVVECSGTLPGTFNVTPYSFTINSASVTQFPCTALSGFSNPTNNSAFPIGNLYISDLYQLSLALSG